MVLKYYLNFLVNKRRDWDLNPDALSGLAFKASAIPDYAIPACDKKKKNYLKTYWFTLLQLYDRSKQFQL